ncbi:MAG: hypothetical protein L3J57_03585 [Desulfuromusa sp.]|nr:hypothetical protein [Desulfuromusa sp.]
MQLNLTLAVADLNKTEQFYREVLLLSPELIRNSKTKQSYIVLSLEQMKIVFQPLRDMEAQHPALLQSLNRNPFGVGVQLELSCNNLDDIYRMVKYYLWPICYELDDHEHHRRELWLQDPDGYLLVLNEEK